MTVTLLVAWTVILALLATISVSTTYRLDTPARPTRAARLAHAAVTAWVVVGILGWIVSLQWGGR